MDTTLISIFISNLQLVFKELWRTAAPEGGSIIKLTLNHKPRHNLQVTLSSRSAFPKSAFSAMASPESFSI